MGKGDDSISVLIAKKISGSGLTYGHLKCVFTRDGEEGLSILFKSKTNNKVRVTNRKDIIKKIVNHFTKIKV